MEVFIMKKLALSLLLMGSIFVNYACAMENPQPRKLTPEYLYVLSGDNNITKFKLSHDFDALQFGLPIVLEEDYGIVSITEKSRGLFEKVKLMSGFGKKTDFEFAVFCPGSVIAEDSDILKRIVFGRRKKIKESKQIFELTRKSIEAAMNKIVSRELDQE
jgi:hypothetical protein